MPGDLESEKHQQLILMFVHSLHLNEDRKLHVNPDNATKIVSAQVSLATQPEFIR